MNHRSDYGLTAPPPADWRHHGACTGHDEPDIWFAGRNGSEARAQTEEAQAICYGCPVLQQCGAWALETHEVWGVWGGMTETQRRSVLRRRGIRVDVPDGKPAKPKPKKREPAKCGTRGGYQKHLREKTEICGPCRRANTDAHNRLLRTGTTKAAA